MSLLNDLNGLLEITVPVNAKTILKIENNFKHLNLNTLK